ncbi:mannose-1-phosphate guanylyltransferase/mannose-6-phosphate isomerase [Morganella morganii]|uniref:mannose-1-phosphate guanylyltransferase/mannose-6-phosphate isomerase n=1 Tax=Morganella morganii TaxID=582 RepID=UPI0004684044|nr:mannose-1-phosphate guanylyltransferase/mannose-6-phosphate isomerase [Morganella morganii]
MILPIIMAGGVGSRLWPLSRFLYPKQFLSLSSDYTMLQETMQRANLVSDINPFIICNEEHRFIVAEQLRELNLNHSGILLEPEGKNTAPTIALAAFHAIENNQDPLMLVLAADHVIKDELKFKEIILQAKPFAENDNIVTFGITPTSPETGYGYIHLGNKISNNIFFVNRFVEKPDYNTATKYFNSQEYVWNSGMFLSKASVYLRELKKFHPRIYDACQAAYQKSYIDLDFIRLDKVIFSRCPSESIDYAVMEKTDSAVVIPMDVSWSDVGSWDAIWNICDKDPSGNVLRGDVITHNTKNSYIYSKDKLVTAVGINDLVIVSMKDAVLVASKDNVQDVKSIVDRLKNESRTEYIQHNEIFRPWGTHEKIAEGPRFHVKKIVVKTGERTATQIHYHRAEHWIVVSGTARVKNGDDTYLLCENESTFIPIGSPHSIENPGKVPLHLIEVRSGCYLKDDDIVRVENYSKGEH